MLIRIFEVFVLEPKDYTRANNCLSLILDNIKGTAIPNAIHKK